MIDQLVVLTAIGLLGLAIFLYVLMDGYSLGIGILFPFIENPEHKDLMINSVTPLWDGNQTWLVFGAAMLYACFPKAYSSLLTMLYSPILLMLIALVFRGITFEFKHKEKKFPKIWDWTFFSSTFFAAFAQGLILGAFITGHQVFSLDGQGARLVWLTPFSVITAISVVCGYALLGTGWLIYKTEGELQQKMRVLSKHFLVAVTLAMIVVSIYTPLSHPDIAVRWFSWPNIALLSPLPTMTAVAIVYLWHLLSGDDENRVFFVIMFIFLCGFIGLAVGLWPYIIPRTMTFFEAAAAPRTIRFVLQFAMVSFPLLLAYTFHAYYVFRGKVKLEDGYD
ncbi:MAG: ubiquinol oxidase subunit II [Legionellales bacterium]|nr:ubiquinol oxidase subunit II [Legionellales bacterium]|tara:strand:+ start:514 stop:1521 length:1008 start_codon:yes stop_codon:yes gene_type:complete